MDLEHDAFMVTYAPHLVEVKDIEEKIRGIGYTPRQVTSVGTEVQGGATRDAQLPAPVAAAATAATESSKLVFVDFYASWCGPCKVLEEKVFPASAVRQALKDFEFVKVDTDKFPEAAEYFQVIALPTLVVLDANGDERYRHVGPISAEDLVQALANTKVSDVSDGAQ